MQRQRIFLSNFKRIVFFLLFTLTFFNNLAFASTTKLRPDVKAYIQRISKEYHFNEKQLISWFTLTPFNPNIIALMEKPAEVKPWYLYRNALVTDKRAYQGVEFWERNRKALTEVEKQYGVPASVIVAIIGIETHYGSNTGNISIMSSLSTLAFDYPRRAKYFQHELTQFLLLAREQKWNPLLIKGSYAGAMGYPQFMPSSYRKYAIDFDRNGDKNLITDPHDAIASIANYLHNFGWQSNEPIAVKAYIVNNRYASLPISYKPHYTLEQLSQYGVYSPIRLPAALPTGLLVLDKEYTPEQWLTFHNFSVITRYNASPKYAMAVYQLSQRILQLKSQMAAQRQSRNYQLAQR